MEPRFSYRMRVPEVFLSPLRQKLEEFPGCARDREKYLFVLHLVARQLRRVYRDTRMAGGRYTRKAPRGDAGDSRGR